MLQQLPQLTDLLAKVLKKLIVNLTMAINSASSIARTWIPDIFDGMDLEKLNSLMPTLFLCKPSAIQHKCYKGKLCNNLSNESCTELAQDWIRSRKLRNIKRLASKLNTVYGRITLKLQINQPY